MANLLDNPNDVGMLSLGLRLLSTPGKFGQALGTAGLGAMGDMQQAKQAQAMAQQRLMAQEMQRMQLENIKRQQAQAAMDQARKAKDDSILQETFTQMPGPMPDGSAGVDPRFHLPTMISKGLSMDSVPEALKLQSVLNPQRKLTAYKPGDQVRDESGNVVFSVPEKPEAKPEALRALALIYGENSPEYVQAARQYAQKMTTHQPGVNVTYGAPVAGVGPDGNPLFFQPSKDGKPPSIIQGVAPPKPDEKALTEGQAKALTFASRMLSSDRTLNELSQKGVNVSAPGSRLGFGVGTVVNAMSSPDRQRLEQAKRDFINATLRRESGAVIGADEFENADKQYFPQVGDSQAVIEQKARNRRSAIEGIRADVPSSRQQEVDRIANQTGGAPVKILGDADYKALPSGALFVGPDGKTRRKP